VSGCAWVVLAAPVRWRVCVYWFFWRVLCMATARTPSAAPPHTLYSTPRRARTCCGGASSGLLVACGVGGCLGHGGVGAVRGCGRHLRLLGGRLLLRAALVSRRLAALRARTLDALALDSTACARVGGRGECGSERGGCHILGGSGPGSASWAELWWGRWRQQITRAVSAPCAAAQGGISLLPACQRLPPRDKHPNTTLLSPERVPFWAVATCAHAAAASRQIRSGACARMMTWVLVGSGVAPIVGEESSEASGLGSASKCPADTHLSCVLVSD
jgi:hypothetical protein